MKHVGETNFDLDSVPTPKSSGWSELENTARQVILTAKIHNDSYNPHYFTGIGTSGRMTTAPGYDKTLPESAQEAAQQLGNGPASTQLVSLLLAACWNDALAWATETATGWKV